MIPRRFFEFTKKPFSVFQTLARRGFSFNYQHSSLLTSQESYSRENSGRQNEDRERSNNSNNDNSYYGCYIGLSALLPLFVVMTNKLNTASCFLFGRNKLEKDKLAERVASVQYPSNNPIEDRWAVAQLHAIPGFVTMVFDGHGGAQVAEFAKEKLPVELEKALKANKGKSFANEEEYIKTSILEAFDRVEEDYLKIAKEALSNGNIRAGRVGACALITVVTGNKVYVANAGDCQGVICRNEQGKVAIQRLNSKLNANSKKEQKRLKEQFKDEDIVYCVPGEEKACYVKKRLQPTRAFGDFLLKHQSFNGPHGANFGGPYITHVPVIKVFEIQKNDKYMILSTDGMWDELTKDDVGKFTEKFKNDKEKLTTELLNNALQVAAKRQSMSEETLRALALGERRDYHDDMTILVIDLENQGK